MKNTFLTEMQSRGYLNQCTDLNKLANISGKSSFAAYIGFDCTANSLHVEVYCKYGFKITTKIWSSPNFFGWGHYLIGDPSGKDTTRKI